MKTFILSAPAGANAVSAKNFLEADGSGNVKAFDGTGTILGLALTNKDTGNEVGCVKQGLIKVPTVNATYNFGDKVEWVSGHKVQAMGTGVLVGTCAETKTTTTADNEISVYINFA